MPPTPSSDEMPTEREIKMAKLMLEDSSPDRQYRMLSILAVHDPFLFADLWGIASEDICVMSVFLENNNATSSEREESSSSKKDSKKRSRADAQGDEGHQDTAPRDRESRSTDHERGQDILETAPDTLILHAGPIAENATEINVDEGSAFPAMKQRGDHTMNPLPRSTIHIKTGIPAERWEPGTVDDAKDKDRLRKARSGSGPVRVVSTNRKSMTTTPPPQSQSPRFTPFHRQDHAGPSDISIQPKFSIATVSSNTPQTESQNKDQGSIEQKKPSTDYVKTADKILDDLSRLTATDHRDLDGSWERFTSCIDRMVAFVSSVPESERRSSGLDTWIQQRINLWKRVIIRKRDNPKSKPRVLAMMRCYMVAGEHLLRSAPDRQLLRQCRIIRRDLDDKLRKAKWRDPRSSEVQTVAGESGEEEEPGAMV